MLQGPRKHWQPEQHGWKAPIYAPRKPARRGTCHNDSSGFFLTTLLNITSS